MRPVPQPALLVRVLLALSAMVLALAGTMAHAELPARPSGPILDAADIIPAPEEAALDRKLRDYNMRTGRALMVVSVTSLEGEDVATYANNLGHAWGVGGKETDQGLIFLVAPTERKVRIETGYGVEQYLPDVLASRIIREQVTPKFKAGDMPGGITAGIDAITAQLDRDPAEAKAIAEAAKAAAAQREDSESGSSIASVAFWLIMMIVMISLFSRRGRRGYRRSGIDPGIVLWGISEAMHHSRGGGSDWGGFGGGGGGGGSDWGGFGGGDFGGGGASGDW